MVLPAVQSVKQIGKVIAYIDLRWESKGKVRRKKNKLVKYFNNVLSYHASLY